MKFRISQDCDYVMGYLRYGHLEGEIEADSLEEAKEKIEKYPRDYMELIVDDYDVEDYDCGDNEVEIEQIEE